MAAITPSSAPSLKRRAASPENSDSENVDPNLLDSFGKRKRAAFDDDVSASKQSRFSLSSISMTKSRPSCTISTPRIDTFQSWTPVSAPPAAGRSPTKPKKNSLPQPHRRFAPPSFGTKSPALSISAALSGTLANKKSKKVRTLEESKPKAWFFDIFEEPEQVQNDRMNEWTISQSAISLDISDDESKAKERTDRGKENIDPNQVSAPITRSMAAAKAASHDLRQDIMTDDTRSPLSDLNPTEYYAEGLDATSVVLVQDDASVDEKQTESIAADEGTIPAERDLTVQAAEVSEVKTDLSSADIAAVILAAAPNWETETLIEEIAEDPVDNPHQEDLEIWESESAKDENEKQEKSLEDGVFALQEL